MIRTRNPARRPATAPPEAEQMAQANDAGEAPDQVSVPLYRPALGETPSERIARKYGRQDPAEPKTTTTKAGPLGALSARDKKLLVLAGSLFLVAGGVFVNDRLNARPAMVTTVPGMPGGPPTPGMPGAGPTSGTPGVTPMPGASGVPPMSGAPSSSVTPVPGTATRPDLHPPASTAQGDSSAASAGPGVANGPLPGTRTVPASPTPASGNAVVTPPPVPAAVKATPTRKTTSITAAPTGNPRSAPIPDVFRPKGSGQAAPQPTRTAVPTPAATPAPTPVAVTPAPLPAPLPAPAPVVVPAPVRVTAIQPPSRPPVPAPTVTTVRPIPVTPTPVTITPARPPAPVIVTPAPTAAPASGTPGVVFTTPSQGGNDPALSVVAVTTTGIPTVTLQTPEGETTLVKGDRVPGTDATVTSITEKNVVLTSKSDLRPITITVETLR